MKELINESNSVNFVISESEERRAKVAYEKTKNDKVVLSEDEIAFLKSFNGVIYEKMY